MGSPGNKWTKQRKQCPLYLRFLACVSHNGALNNALPPQTLKYLPCLSCSQIAESHHKPYKSVFVCHAHKIPFHHKHCISTSTSHAHKVRFHYNPCMSFFLSHGCTMHPHHKVYNRTHVYCEDTAPSHHTLCTITFQFIVYTVCFTVSLSANLFTYLVFIVPAHFVAVL